MEETTQRHFFHHGKDGFENERVNCHWCQLRSFPTHQTVPITIVNEIDDETLPLNFQFIDGMIHGKGVEAAEDSFRNLEEEFDEDEDEDYDDDEPKKAYAYHTYGKKAGLLRSKLLDSAVPLYECHQGCSCSESCPNRVVERGRTVPLQIFRTRDRGWGVRATEPIKKGQFIDRYLGEVITSAEADRRRHNSTISQRKDVYLFALDKFTSPDSLDSRLKGPPLEVDGEFMSGPTRFINHSCDPSMRIFARVGDHADKHLHDLALFAIRDIARGEELTFDYVDGVSEEDDDANFNAENMTRCLCGSKKCRKWLW